MSKAMSTARIRAFLGCCFCLLLIKACKKVSAFSLTWVFRFVWSLLFKIQRYISRITGPIPSPELGHVFWLRSTKAYSPTRPIWLLLLKKKCQPSRLRRQKEPFHSELNFVFNFRSGVRLRRQELYAGVTRDMHGLSLSGSVMGGGVALFSIGWMSCPCFRV